MNCTRLLIISIFSFCNFCSIIGYLEIYENSTHNAKRIKRGSLCIPYAVINNCPPKYPMHIMMSYEFTASVTPGCTDSSIYYNWEASSMESDDVSPIIGNQEIFIIQPFSFTNGQQVIILKITEVDEPDIETEIFMCYIDIVSENPIPFISGGNDRTVTTNIDYMVDSSESINFRHDDIVPIWSVDCTKKDSSCSQKSFNCPSPKANSGLQWSFNTQNCYDYTIKLSLKQGQLDETPPFIQKLITVMDEDVETSHFECVYNCNNTGYFLVDKGYPVTFKVVCDSNCKPLAPQYVFQYHETDDQIRTLNPNKNFKQNRLVEIKAGQLKYDSLYTLKGDLKIRTQLKESIKVLFKTYKFIQIFCTVQPKEGIALHTVFKFDCRESLPKDYTFFYDILQPDINGAFTMRSSFPVFETQLGVSNGILIRLTYGQTGYGKLRKYKQIKVLADTTMNVNDSMKLLQKIVHTNDAFQISRVVQSILSEHSKDLTETEGFQLRSLVLEELFKVKIDNENTYSIMDATVKVLMKEPFTVAYAKRLKLFCSRVLQSSAAVKFDARFQQAFNKGKAQTQILKECRGKNLESRATLSSDSDVTPISEGILMEGEDVFIENYPNYDEEVANDIEQDAEDQEHDQLMQDAFKMAKNLEIKKSIEKKVGDTTLAINKDEPKAAFEKEHKFLNGSFTYQKEFPNQKAIVSIYKTLEPTSYICQYPEISTTVVEIATAALHNDDAMGYISVPVLINFDNLLTPHINKINGSVTFPTNRTNWDYNTLMQNTTVYRLDVFKGHGIFIEFLDLSDGAKLKIAVTRNIRPNVFQLQYDYIVDESDEGSWNIHPKIDTSDGNCWIYMAVFIHEDMLRNTSFSGSITVNYLVKFTSKSCVIWDKHSREWETKGCRLNAASDQSITCACMHSSIFAGMISNVDSKLDPFLPMINNLKLVTCYIIYYFVASVVGLYCVAMCFSLMSSTVRDCKDNIFFLADNLKNDLYCYIIIVKTGNVRGAGTTSNIMIRLQGEIHNSKEHVLNYPDPDKHLFQRDSEQWFALTVSNYLGEVKGIDVWFDSIGYRPTWYCDNIRVIDLQTKDIYYFDIKLWFDVLDDCISCSAKATAESSLANWNTKLWSNFKFHVGGGHTWNIFSRTYDAEFSYAQRLTCILSQILNVYVFTIFIYGSPELRMRDSLSLGIIEQRKIFVVGLISGFISFVVNTAVVVTFRHSRSTGDVYNMVLEQQLLPTWATTLAWGIVLANVHLSLIYLITFGFWVPTAESIQWIMSTSIGIIINIFVFENLYLSFEEIFFKYYSRTHSLFKREYQFDNIIVEVERQRTFLYNHFGEYLLRPYMHHSYKVLSDDIVASKKIWNKMRLDVSSLFKDFIIFLFYFLLVYLLLFSERLSVLYDSNKRMGKIACDGLGEREWFNLENIETYNDIYNYIEFTLIPALNGRFWYGKWEIHNPGSMTEISNKLIGVAQIRQQRMDFGPCLEMALPCCNSSTLLCHSDYVSTSNHSRMGTFRKPLWIYKSAKETKLPSVTGTLSSYDGGGFIANLGRTKRNSLYILEYMKQRQWIDINTKVVFIDFWTYNANYNLFNVAQILIERSSTSYILSSCKIFTSHLLITGNIRTELRSGIVVLLLFCSITAILIRHIESIIKLKKKYFKIFWNYYDWSLLGMTVFTIVLYIQRNDMAEKVLRRLLSVENNDFVLYFHLVKTSQSLVLLSALLVCLATLRVWKYLRFWSVFRTLEWTILKSAKPLLINAGYFLLIIVSYSSMGFLLFGGFHPDMNTFFKIAATLFILSFGFDEVDSAPELLDNYLGYFGQLYKVSFMVISLLMVNIITTIIIIHLEDSKKYFSNKRDPFTIFDYVKEECRYYKQLFVKRTSNIRLRGGGVNALEGHLINSKESLGQQMEKVSSKSLEHRYADSEKISKSKLNSMAAISAAVIQRKLLRRDHKLRRKDYKTMAAVALDFKKRTEESTDDKEDNQIIFFTQKSSDDHVELIRDYRLLRIEYVVKRLLDDNLNKTVERIDYKAEPDAIKFNAIYNNLIALLEYINTIKFMR